MAVTETPSTGPEVRQVRSHSPTGGISRRLVLLFAVACAIVVANLYYAQPLLDEIARDFHSASGAVGQVVTVTQIGYAIGLFFVVPLGDLLDRRKLILVVLIATALALVGEALAPSLAVLVAAGFAIGLTSVVVQVLVPFAADLARDDERGRVIGTVMSGLLLGILLARTVSGLIAQVAGWRVVYWMAAALMILVLLVLAMELPTVAPHVSRMSYGRLLSSVGTLVREEPLLRRRALYGLLAFGAFNVLWNSLAFLLSRPPYSYGSAIIGLFGLAGVAGTLCASVAGRLADRGWTRAATGVFVGLTLLAFGLLALGASSLGFLLAGIVVLDLGVQGTQITNQSLIYARHPEARSRITTAYMVSYFIGGSLGSALSAIAFERAGWGGVIALGVGFAGLAVLLWLAELGARPRAR